jgi:hypothetical protein
VDVFAGVAAAGAQTWPVLGVAADMHNTIAAAVITWTLHSALSLCVV